MMPELPEVETVVRGLRALLPGRSIVGVRWGKTDFVEDPTAIAEALPGNRIAAVERYGKFIRLKLELRDVPSAGDSSGVGHLVIHLGMTGRLAVRRAQEPFPLHTHGFFELDDGHELHYTDARRFGQIFLLPESRAAAFGERLGADPLEISAADFRRELGRRRARIKALLLDQSVLRGVGNIYADESLWRSRIHPSRLGAQLTAAQLTRLHRAVQRVLCSAIRLGGSSISDFLDAQGNPGEFQLRHRVYQRHGKPCPRCGATIRRAIIAGRGSHFCPRCQPPPRRGSHRQARAAAH
jgi:formamidopyrimidine-DNA glycosylase